MDNQRATIECSMPPGSFTCGRFKVAPVPLWRRVLVWLRILPPVYHVTFTGTYTEAWSAS